MNQPQIHFAVCLGERGAQRFAVLLTDETFYDANVCENGIRTRFTQEHVRVTRRASMNKELYTWQLSPNDVEQLRGFTRWQAFNCIADFNEPHRVHFDPLKSLLNPTGNGFESPLGILPARLGSGQANV